VNKIHLLGMLFCLLLLAAVFSGPAFVQDAPKPVINHYKVYNVDNVEMDEIVSLKVRFEEAARKVHLKSLVHFANPVSKNGEEIVDPVAHLTWYYFEQDDEEPMRTVTFKNQFGKQVWVLGQPKLLVVPAEKNNEGTPEKQDHYKAYEVLDVIGEQVETSVSLVDQWYQQTSELGDARFYCVPVRKKREGKEPEPIIHPKLHLAVYAIEPMNLDPMEFVATDQFRADSLVARKSFWLCVPSIVLGVEE
jgi:hypothetical protein